MIPDKLNPLITQSIAPILAHNESQLMSITAIFVNPDNPSFKVILSRQIETLTIEQDYINNYADKLLMMMKLSIAQFSTLYQWRKNLRCELRFSRASYGAADIYVDNPHIIKQYNVFFITQTDPFKLAPSDALINRNKFDNSGTDENTIDVKIELIPTDIYLLRKRKVNFIANNVTMENMLYYICSQLQITQSSIVSPDNKKSYLQLIIPPMMGIDEVFTYLQYGQGNGLYNYGFCYYYTNGTIYIYPRFADPAEKNIVHLYSIGEGLYVNKLGYSCVDAEGTTHVLINTQVNMKDYSDAAVENDKTAIMFQKQNQLINNCHKMLKDGSFSILNDNFVTEHWIGKKGMKDNSFTVEYRQSHSNEYVLRSELVRLQGISLDVIWKQAVPWTFQPNRVVKYHFEYMGKYKTLRCSCEQVTYAFKKVPDSNIVPVMECQAGINLLCNDVNA